MTNQAVFERSEELARMESALASRASFLVHGPAGVGKTLLLRTVSRHRPQVLYCSPCRGTQSVVRHLAEALADCGNSFTIQKLGGREANCLSAIALKGLVRDSLATDKYTIVLDHLAFASQSFASELVQITGNRATPIVAAARSVHMEETGFLLKLFPFRTDRMEIKNFDRESARAFAALSIGQAGLTADNLHEFEERLVQASDGNPGSILCMIEMAKKTKYRRRESVLFTPLYVDFTLYSNNSLK